MTRPAYLPWVRAGLVAAVTNIDPLKGALPARTTLRATAAVGVDSEAGVDVTVMGPGDLTSVDTRFVIRTDPQNGAIEVEPNYFCVAELPGPDLPWMLTPARANGAGQLRPFAVLVVVAADGGSINPGSPERLPVLHVNDLSAQLPDLTQSFAWAHAQVEHPETLLESSRPTGLARLLCPRKLTRNTRYLAAVVPAFETGRLAALGLKVPDAATTQPAWDVAKPGPLDLPAYHAWTFTTGDDGDFESLVLRLKSVPLTGDSTAGRLGSVDAQAGLPALPEWRFPGALGLCPAPAAPPAFQDRLIDLIDGTATDPSLTLPPPLYARWYTATPTLAAAAPWHRQLNLDPRYRSAAAIGARLVQEHQEALMAAAWAQIGEVEAANALLRQAQVARAAGSAIHTRIGELDAATLLLLAGPMHTRIIDPDTGTTIRQRVAVSRVPEAMISGTYRRVLRPRGPLGRRTGRTPAALLAAVNGGMPVVRPRVAPPDGLCTIDSNAPAGAPAWCEVTAHSIAERGHAEPPGKVPLDQWQKMIGALVATLADNPLCEPPSAVADPLPLDEIKDIVLAATDPRTTVPARVGARVTPAPGWAPKDPLTPIMATPRIDTPLARDLVALSPDLLLPGVADLPREAVSALPANHSFVEAVMVGANQEMMRELLWRGYPTDQRGTCLHRFWDRSGSVTGPADDYPGIDQTWSGALGTHQLGGPNEQVVLVIRGEVLRRYPHTVIYAARARWDGDHRTPVPVPPGAHAGDPGYPERYPACSGTIPPDISYVGFDLPDDARGDPDRAADKPGWFFVLQQPPASTRFGLDADRSKHSPGQGPDDLSWPAVATTASGHVDLTGPLSDLTLPGWGMGATSADLAMWCEQRPFRVCIHASELLTRRAPQP